MQHCRIQRGRRTIDPNVLPWLLLQLQEPFVGQAAQERADVRQNSLARRCVALRQLIDQLGESDLASVQRLMISAPMASALRLACVRGCTRASPAHASRGRSIAPFRIDASGDQNSAGKYPLISRPMQISTRVGVVHDMALSSVWGQYPFS
jgi:predicted DNA-binding ribbon-helix-helix protein